MSGEWETEETLKLFNKSVLLDNFCLVRNGKINKIRINNYNKMLKCNKNEMIYYRERENYKDYITIIFSKRISVFEFINSKISEIQNAKISIINDTKVKIYAIESYVEEGQKRIEGSAYFKCGEYSICINTKGTTEDEFIDVIKTIIAECSNL